MLDGPTLLQVKDLKKHFILPGGFLKGKPRSVQAVDGISFDLGHSETLGLVGESGCGKSTAAKTIVRLIEPTSGTIRLDDVDITRLSRPQLHAHRRNMQVVFQDPYSSLNPKMSAGSIVAEPLINYGVADRHERKERVAALFSRVGLRAELMARYPHEFSGGQRQRLGIARALALSRSLIIADEPVSALDVSVQAQVINLFVSLQEELGLSYIFVAHDLGVVRHISHRVAVMYLGRIVELARTRELFSEPLHPYTKALLAAAPVPNPKRQRERIVLRGDVPSPVNPPSGCRFHTRCPMAFDRCRVEDPKLRSFEGGRLVACHLYDTPAAAAPHDTENATSAVAR
jgi:peptide/nickel transport system ATP-binding protein/oligopeptide transport system ATP-binding protein